MNLNLTSIHITLYWDWIKFNSN